MLDLCILCPTSTEWPKPTRHPSEVIAGWCYSDPMRCTRPSIYLLSDNQHLLQLRLGNGLGLFLQAESLHMEATQQRMPDFLPHAEVMRRNGCLCAELVRRNGCLCTLATEVGRRSHLHDVKRLHRLSQYTASIVVCEEWKTYRKK